MSELLVSVTFSGEVMPSGVGEIVHVVAAGNPKLASVRGTDTLKVIFVGSVVTNVPVAVLPRPKGGAAGYRRMWSPFLGIATGYGA